MKFQDNVAFEGKLSIKFQGEYKIRQQALRLRICDTHSSNISERQTMEMLHVSMPECSDMQLNPFLLHGSICPDGQMERCNTFTNDKGAALKPWGSVSAPGIFLGHF